MSKSEFYGIYMDSVEESSLAKADYLICNDTSKGSSKVKKAIDKGIPIISQYDFIDILNSKES